MSRILPGNLLPWQDRRIGNVQAEGGFVERLHTVLLEDNLREMEQFREAYWSRYPSTSPLRLRWRAQASRHCLHVVPGQSILELGAGSGLWTEHISSVFKGENPITAVTYCKDFAQKGSARNLTNTKFVYVDGLKHDLPAEAFDYVVGTAILCHDKYQDHLEAIYRLLKPGGQMLFFEANFWNPQVFLKSIFRSVARLAGNARCQVGMRKYELLRVASHQGFSHISIVPYDIFHPATPRFLIPWIQSAAFLLEQAPVVRELCGTLYIWAKKPGYQEPEQPRGYLARYPALRDSISVVIPAHNEEANIRPLVESLLQAYDPYLHEIIIVNDNSSDGTEEVARKLAERAPRIKLVNRTPPAGVGRALRDGYRTAGGSYILSMDCDFVHIVPELRDLFHAVAEGWAGAIGSRFSHDSMLIDYPFLKVFFNRAFHFLVTLFLGLRVRDATNNLKLYRAEIFKTLDIEQGGFAANAETGLKPLLGGYPIKEVPISWINRRPNMGRSSFKVLNVAPGYFSVLMKEIWRSWRHRNS